MAPSEAGPRPFRLVPLLILGFVGFVTSFGAHIVAVNLPTYAAEIGVGVAVIGLLIAAYDLAEIVAKPVFGGLADRRGMKQTMLAGIVVFVLASLAYLIVNPRLLLLIRFLQGAGAAALSAVSLALVAVYAGQSRGRAYGVYNAIKGAGYVVSPIIGGAIVFGSNFSMIFVAAAAVGALAFVLALALPQSGNEPGVREAAGGLLDDDDGVSLRAVLEGFRHPELWPWYAVTVTNMFLAGILFGFLPVRVHELGFGPLRSGVLLTAVTAGYVLIQPVAGVLADRAGTATTVRAGLALAAVAVILTPFVTGAALVITSVLAGFGVGTVWTNTDALISRLAQETHLAATMGAAGTFKEFGDMLGPLLIGLLSQAFGLPAGFVACGGLGLLALLLVSRNTGPRLAY